jgi:hypothetical protein
LGWALSRSRGKLTVTKNTIEIQLLIILIMQLFAKFWNGSGSRVGEICVEKYVEVLACIQY